VLTAAFNAELIASLSTANKIGLGTMALIVIGFSLVSSMLIPRRNPDFPGAALPVFLIATFVLFVAMLAAVEVFGVEEPEEGGGHEAPSALVQSP
jgi:hypothetical protein